jgi:hypothetical protein
VQERTARDAVSVDRGVGSCDQPSLACLLRLQRTAGNRVVARLVADHRDTRVRRAAHAMLPPARAAAGTLPSDTDEERKPPYSVRSAALADDMDEVFVDPDGTLKQIWTPSRGYIRHPHARYLDKTIGEDGRIGGWFKEGVFHYVVDERGRVLIAPRSVDPADPDGWALPHPTLIGGKDPKVLAAGEVEIRAGQIYRIDNYSGHYHPGRPSLRAAVTGFLRIRASAIHPDFRAESVHIDDLGFETRKPFRTLRTFPREFRTALRGLSTDVTRVRPRTEAFRAGVRTAGATAAGALVDLALMYVASKVKEKFDNAIIERELNKLAAEDIKRLAPDVKALLADKRQELKNLLSADSGAPIYLNVRFTISLVQTPKYNQYDGFSSSPDMVESPPVVKVGEVAYGREPLNAAPTHSMETSLGAAIFTTIVPYSRMLSPEEIAALENEPARPPIDGQRTRHAGDTEIREWLKRHPSDIGRLPVWDKARIIHRLLDGWVSDDDLQAIESVCKSVTDKKEMEEIDKAIRPRVKRLWSARQRMWLNRILDLQP